MISYINEQHILSKHQFGFQKNYSTEHAIIELSDKITKAIDQGEYSIGIFLNLSKAFDTVNHQILLTKLEHYGIRGLCLKWFESYLHGRTQIVKFGAHRSNKMFLTTRVPQGSILVHYFFFYISMTLKTVVTYYPLLFMPTIQVLFSLTSVYKHLRILYKRKLIK